MSKKNIIYTFLSLLVTVLACYYLFRTVKFGDLKDIYKGLDHGFLLVFFLLSMAGALFRTWRYQVTLNTLGYYPKILALFLTTLVRNLFSDLLPARIGTTVYIYIAHTRLGLPLSAATSSFSLAFIFDFLSLPILIALALFFLPEQIAQNFPMAPMAACLLFGISLGVLIFLPFLCRIGLNVLRRLPIFGRKYSERLIEFLSSVSQELLLIQRRGAYLPIFLLSLLVRVCKYASLYVFLLAILLPLKFDSEGAHPATTFFGLLAAELAASLPISGIAGFGAYESAWAFTFNLLGFPADIAKLTGVAHHLFTQIYGYGLGLMAMLILLVPVFYSRPLKKDSERLAPSMYARIVLLTLLTTFASTMIWKRALTAQALSQSHNTFQVSTTSPAEESAIAAISAEFPGRIIFDSNRSGSFGIYSMTAQGSDVTKLVDSEQHEMYPDASPDGQLIVFAKARSLIRLAPSEIWLANRDGSSARKIIDSGSFPSFSKDGSKIFYESGRGAVYVYHLSDRQSKQIFPRKQGRNAPYAVVKPRVSPDERYVAFTSDQPSQWHAWVADLHSKQRTLIHAGCEPSWFPDSKQLAWMKKSGAKSGSGVMSYNLASHAVAELADDGAPLGHEYFPSVTADGKYLLYAACPPDQHSHTDANYQIHLLNIQTGQRQRLQFDTATNRWPRLQP